MASGVVRRWRWRPRSLQFLATLVCILVTLFIGTATHIVRTFDPTVQAESRTWAKAPDPSAAVAAAGAAVGAWRPGMSLPLKQWRPQSGYTIPRTLHQSWPTRNIPAELRKWVQSWRKLQPDWSYKLHTDADNEQLVARHYAWFEPTYRQLSFIQRADVARLMYMHHFGGVCARPLLRTHAIPAGTHPPQRLSVCRLALCVHRCGSRC